MRIDDTSEKLEDQVITSHSNSNRHKKILLLLVMGILLFAAFLFFWNKSRAASMEAVLTSQEAEIKELEEELAAVTAIEKPVTEESKQPKENRRVKDTELAREFLKTLLTWRNYEVYCEVRAILQETYGISADDPLLTSFMPDVTEEVFGDSNMAFLKAETYLVHADEDHYSYAAFCNVDNRSNGNTGYGKVAVFYTIDGAENIQEVSAYPLVK